MTQSRVAPGVLATRSALRTAGALIGFLGLVFAIGAIGSVISAPAISGWYAEAAKPMWTPSNEVFAPVWAALYSAMAVAAWLIWRRPESRARSRALTIYGIQLALNASWTPVFFGLGSLIGGPGLWIALVVMVLLDFAVLATIIRFADVSRAAAALLVPYWLWLLFATTLNAAMAVLSS
jgi:translocator protein